LTSSPLHQERPAFDIHETPFGVPQGTYELALVDCLTSLYPIPNYCEGPSQPSKQFPCQKALLYSTVRFSLSISRRHFSHFLRSVALCYHQHAERTENSIKKGGTLSCPHARPCCLASGTRSVAVRCADFSKLVLVDASFWRSINLIHSNARCQAPARFFPRASHASDKLPEGEASDI
jgi:hypothetical protein